DLAAELRRGHVEQVESEDDELRPLHARLLQSFPARKRGEHRLGMAAAEDCLLKQQRPARVIDQENAAVVIHHAAVISRSLAMARWRSSTNTAICSAMLHCRTPKRMALKASRSGTPIAVSTVDGVRSPELQADPADSENRRMAMITGSASPRSKLTF